MKKNTFVLLFSLFVAGGLMLCGCLPVDNELSGSIDVEEEVNINVAAATGTVTGRVVSANPHEPIEGATVELIVNGAKRTTTSATSTDEDLKGYFSFSGVPANTAAGTTVGYTLNISATGYADFTTRVAVPQSFDNTPVTVNLGTIGLGEVFDLAVVVVDEDGIPVADVKVFAAPTGNACGVITTVGWGASSASFISAQTASSGIATLENLNECYTYNIIAPAFDADADGVIDYTTSVFAYAGAVVSDETCSLVLTTARRGQGITPVLTSLGDEPLIPAFNLRTITDAGNVSQLALTPPGSNTMGPSDKITIVYNYPVALTGDVDISYTNYLVNPTTDVPAPVTGYPEEILVANTAAMDSTGCILTITPSATLPENVWLEVYGEVTAHTDPDLEDDYVTSSNIALSVYVHTAAGLTATPTITVDNYDGIASTHFDPGTGAPHTPNGAPTNNVYIEFGEYVQGTIRVIEYTQIARDARPAVIPVAAAPATATNAARVAIVVQDPAFTAVTTVVNGATQDIAGNMVYTDGVQSLSRFGIAAPFYEDILWTGTTAGTYYRYLVLDDAGLPIPLMDGDTITFELDIQDANGTHYYGTLTKTVE